MESGWNSQGRTVSKQQGWDKGQLCVALHPSSVSLEGPEIIREGCILAASTLNSLMRRRGHFSGRRFIVENKNKGLNPQSAYTPTQVAGNEVIFFFRLCNTSLLFSLD